MKYKVKPKKRRNLVRGKSSLLLMTPDKIKGILARHKTELKNRFRVKEIGIFGSAIRAESKPTSDIDILVDFKDEADLIDLTGLALFLEEKLGQRVDIVPKRALREEIREEVLREVVYL